eukprot:scaffold4805_cov136-Cylindrotheca_fusiformis.AAC.18
MSDGDATKTKQQMQDELARQRLEEEMRKIQLETEAKRKAKMRALIGDTAEDVGSRKKGVDESVQKWSEKGKHSSLKVETGDAVKSAKQAYAENLKANAIKGKQYLEDLEEGESAEPTTPIRRFQKPAPDISSILYGSDGEPSKEEADDDPDVPPEEAYKKEFSSIESEEVTMVGLEKHIKIVGTDLQGRKMTKTKIILPKMGGKAAEGNSRPANPDNQLEPKDWDGTFHSLEDIQQRRVEGIDTQNREQYLSPEDFEASFNMTKEAFAKLPKWKRDKMKQALYLF